MTICAPALATKCLPVCLQQLVIGTIENLSEAVYVYVKDITTGRVDILNAESDPAGLVTLDISTYSFVESHAYESWITLSYTNINDKLDIVIEETTADTVALCFIEIQSPGGAYAYISQTLELA